MDPKKHDPMAFTVDDDGRTGEQIKGTGRNRWVNRKRSSKSRDNRPPPKRERESKIGGFLVESDGGSTRTWPLWAEARRWRSRGARSRPAVEHRLGRWRRRTPSSFARFQKTTLTDQVPSQNPNPERWTIRANNTGEKSDGKGQPRTRPTTCSLGRRSLASRCGCVACPSAAAAASDLSQTPRYSYQKKIKIKGKLPQIWGNAGIKKFQISSTSKTSYYTPVGNFPSPSDESWPFCISLHDLIDFHLTSMWHVHMAYRYRFFPPFSCLDIPCDATCRMLQSFSLHAPHAAFFAIETILNFTFCSLI